MKRNNNILLIQAISILIIFITNNTLTAQWVRTNGPGGALVYSLASDSTYIFAGIYGGVYRSADKGSSWTPADKGMPERTSVISLAVQESLIFAGTYKRGIFRSTDNGASWDSLNNGLPDNHEWINGLAFRGDTVFAGIYTGNYGLVYFSADSGLSWKNASSGLPEFTFMNALAEGGGRLFAATADGIYRTDVNGLTWKPANKGIDDRFLNSLAARGDTLYAGADWGGKGIYRSFDGGGEWTLLETGLDKPSVDVILIKERSVFAGVYGNGIVHSTDYGQTWSHAVNGLSDPYVNALTAMGNSVFAGTLAGGIYMSPDNGASWNAVNKGLNLSTAISMILKGDTLLAGTYTGVFSTADNGDTWVFTSNGLDSTYVKSFALSGNNIFALTGKGIYRSENNGADWREMNNGLRASAFNDIVVLDENIFAATDSGVYLSADQGNTWKSSSKGLRTTMDSVVYVSGLEIQDSLIFAGVSGTSGGGIFKSTDYGANWSESDSGINRYTKVNFNSFAAAKNLIFAAYTYGQLYNPIVLGSADSGRSWISMSEGIPPYTETYKFYVIDDSIYALTQAGIYRFNYDSTSWVNADQDFPGEVVSSAYNSKYIFAGINGFGIWRTRRSEPPTAVHDKKGRNAFSYSLGQNYPNPFNSYTVITYSVPVNSPVQIDIYDILGRKVSVLVNREQPAGEYKIPFNASALPSGIYIYKIRAGHFIDSKKMLLLR